MKLPPLQPQQQIRIDPNIFKEEADSSVHFPSNRMEEVSAWVGELYDLVRDKVDEMLNSDHMLVPDLETLDAHVARTSAELFTVCRTHVRLMRLLWEAERDHQRVNRKAKRDLDRTKAVIACRIRDEINRKMTVAEVTDLVDADPELQEEEDRVEREIEKAENKYAEILEHERGIAAMVEALRVKAGLLSGLQGAKNAVTRLNQ